MPEEAPEGQEPENESQEDSQPEPDTFDRDYVEKLRKEAASYRTKLKELEPLAQRAKELEDAKKSETEKLAEKLTAAEKKALDASSSVLRLEVALDKAPEGMSIAQVRKLAKRLSGSSKEELEQDAEELFEDFVSKTPPGRVPKEDLKGGLDPSEDDGFDANKLAERIFSKGRI